MALLCNVKRLTWPSGSRLLIRGYMFRKAMRIRTRLGENTYQPNGPKTCEHTDVCENVDSCGFRESRVPRERHESGSRLGAARSCGGMNIEIDEGLDQCLANTILEQRPIINPRFYICTHSGTRPAR
jgi:hypothetical protein